MFYDTLLIHVIIESLTVLQEDVLYGNKVLQLT